ncbi:MAG: type I methionyl aminopeptidase [Deltaproteobacteria bacterium]|jgi:methionyl aminopeptidase|nr:type I methionyl aminopeptidase [Deltaproteobacteria bacterium]
MKIYRGAFIKNAREISRMREANRIVANILDALGDAVAPDVPTMHFEELSRGLCEKYAVRPAFLGYHGYPFVLCCSVNEQVVHGFPSERLLREGDIVSFDMGVIYEGFYGDAARTYPVGRVSAAAAAILRVTEASLYAGVEKARHGLDVYEIGAAVQKCAETAGFNVVRRFIGHGIGRAMHEKPEVPNFRPSMRGMPLQAGMVVAIEPMVTEGAYEVDVLDDKWTAVTRDKKLAAHFEHSVLVTTGEPEILSVSDRGPIRFFC